MKIPKKLKIGGIVYQVKIIDDLELDGEDGETNRFRNDIRINKLLPQEQKEATLIHEIMHCLNSQIVEEKLGHLFLESLAQQFYQVLKDNNLLK